MEKVAVLDRRFEDKIGIKALQGGSEGNVAAAWKRRGSGLEAAWKRLLVFKASGYDLQRFTRRVVTV